ncbi:uncharacterized protein DNG_05862 [Cephalotrichum gorgonifer]|uniref:Myb-like domain-containing protein n=1 Tax=Cephalotrichum gorgonifer TaxID=2041049 RepID=A0AAE8SVV6_9PEZI|nr:uncharacterized protein DNG_05862 [Cephalotrichum gorgonifer]
MEDGGKGGGAVESSPETQGTSVNTAIVIPEDEDEDEDDSGEEEDKEDDRQHDTVLITPLAIDPLENHASGIPEGEPRFNGAEILEGGLEDPTSAIEPNARVEPPDPLSAPSQASSDTPAPERRHTDKEADEADTTDGHGTADTSGMECDSPVQLPSPPRYKFRLSPCARRSVRRFGDRARGQGGGPTPRWRGPLHQDSDSSDNESTRVLGEAEDEDYNPSHTEADPPLRKRRKISPRPCRSAIGEAEEDGSRRPSRVRRTRKRITTRDSFEGGPAPHPVRATYQQWPLQDVLLKRVMDDGRTVFQLQFTWDSCPQHHRNAHGTEHAETSGHGTKTRSRRGKGSMFTAEEDELLVRLKGGQLAWDEIHERFSRKFPGRSRGSLQVRYCTKLKRSS